MSSSRKSSRKSSKAKPPTHFIDHAFKEIGNLKKEVNKLKKENEKLDAHIKAIYNDNNNMAQQIVDMFSTMDSQGDEIPLIKKVMKEKLSINWRRAEEES